MTSTEEYLRRMLPTLKLTGDAAEQFISSVLFPQEQQRSAICFTGPPICRPFGPDEQTLKDMETRGEAYIVDRSSTLACLAVKEIVPKPKRILDMCAAPGGKSLLLSALFPESSILSCEKDSSRRKRLIANTTRCKRENIEVAPFESVQMKEGDFDLILLDAPCSGQSLLARGEKVDRCFQKQNIERLAGTQLQLLRRGAELLQETGLLIYSTCTFSLQENEKLLRRFLKGAPNFHAVSCDQCSHLQSSIGTDACYRVFPSQGYGAGGFFTFLQRSD